MTDCSFFRSVMQSTGSFPLQTLSTRQRLLEHGVIYLTEHGYHGSGIKGIRADVNIPKGSFYHYFDSKDTFCAAVIEHYIQPFLVRLEVLAQDQLLDAGRKLPFYFRDLIEGAAERNFSGGCLLGNLIGELGADEKLASVAALRLAMRNYATALAVLIRQGQQAGFFRCDLEAMVMADLLVNQWQGALLRARLLRSREPLHACTDFMILQYFREKALAND